MSPVLWIVAAWATVVALIATVLTLALVLDQLGAGVIADIETNDNDCDEATPIYTALLAIYDPIAHDAAADLTDERIEEFITDGV